MIATYSEAHRRLDNVLKIFFVVCVAGIVIGILNYDWWFATVWLIAGFINGIIGASVRQSAANFSTPEDNEFADARVFAGNSLNFTNLLAATVVATGFALRQPWWGVVLAGAATWFASMFGIALLCVPPKKELKGVVD